MYAIGDPASNRVDASCRAGARRRKAVAGSGHRRADRIVAGLRRAARRTADPLRLGSVGAGSDRRARVDRRSRRHLGARPDRRRRGNSGARSLRDGRPAVPRARTVRAPRRVDPRPRRLDRAAGIHAPAVHSPQQSRSEHEHPNDHPNRRRRRIDGRAGRLRGRRQRRRTGRPCRRRSHRSSRRGRHRRARTLARSWTSTPPSSRSRPWNSPPSREHTAGA